MQGSCVWCWWRPKISHYAAGRLRISAATYYSRCLSHSSAKIIPGRKKTITAAFDISFSLFFFRRQQMARGIVCLYCNQSWSLHPASSWWSLRGPVSSVRGSVLARCTRILFFTPAFLEEHWIMHMIPFFRLRWISIQCNRISCRWYASRVHWGPPRKS